MDFQNLLGRLSFKPHHHDKVAHHNGGCVHFCDGENLTDRHSSAEMLTGLLINGSNYVKIESVLCLLVTCCCRCFALSVLVPEGQRRLVKGNAWSAAAELCAVEELGDDVHSAGRGQCPGA